MPTENEFVKMMKCLMAGKSIRKFRVGLDELLFGTSRACGIISGEVICVCVW